MNRRLHSILRGIKRTITRATRRPRVGHVPSERLLSTTPVSRKFGLDRGTPVDRVYIEHFLESNADAIRGRVLEIADDTYTRRFGNSLESVDILHVNRDNPRATIVADLSDAPQIEDESFDCVVLTQTLQFILDVPAAIATLHRVLRPMGAILATVSSITQVSQYDMVRWGDYWRFTEASIGALVKNRFGSHTVTVKSYGNLLTAIALLHGLAAEELPEEQLAYCDPIYPVIIGVRATKE